MAGRLVDRLAFKPLIGWATAWSFDRLRIWAETGQPPESSLKLALIHALARVSLATIWIWHGLVPKLLYQHLDVQSAGFSRLASTALWSASKRNATRRNGICFMNSVGLIVPRDLATDGDWVEAEDLNTGETVAPALPTSPATSASSSILAGISSVKEIKDNPIEVRATGRLRNLYFKLLKDNPDWATNARRHDINYLMARLIFCFFAEDTGFLSRRSPVPKR